MTTEPAIVGGRTVAHDGSAGHTAVTSTSPETAELAAPTAAVGDSMTVAVWTLVSRATGVVRGVVVAAVLGATYFANTYQFTNSLPNLVFYGFLGGSLFSSLLIPALVRHLDAGDRAATERVAGGFFGIVLVAMLAAIPLAVLAAPLALNLGPEAAAAAEQARIGGLLVLMLMPQIALYGVIATATAVMYARRRFALAAAAPALENIGTIVVLALVLVLFPGTAENPSTGALLLLGLGTTGSVGMHAAAQWLGARHLGVRLLPLAGWRDREVREVVRSAMAALAQAGLAALQLLVLLLLANRVAGGVVAFQLAMNFFFLPIALGATPVALSLAPRLSRMTGAAAGTIFRDTYVRGLTFALFVAVPTAVGYLAVATPLAGAVSYGGFGAGGGTELVAASLTALAIGIVGETAFLVSTYACYARKDTATPLRAMALQVAVCLALAGFALTVDGPAVLTVLGCALSAGAVVSAAYLVWTLLRRLPPGEASLARPVGRTILASVVTAIPAAATATGVDALTGSPLLGVLAAALVGATLYGGGQALLRAPELAWITGALRLPRIRPRWRRAHRPTAILVNGGLLLGCLFVGALAGAAPLLAAGLLGALGIAAWVYARPAVAAYLIIFFTPLTAGIDRGTLLPVLRPNEALAMLVGGALAVRWLATARTGRLRWPHLGRTDVALLALGVTSSVVPLLMMVMRERAISGDDLQYCTVLWKYLAIYAIVRSAVSTERQAFRCLLLSMGAASVVCAIGILQALGLFGVPELLATLYAPFGVERTLAIGRGSSTLALAAAVADLAIINLAVAVAMLLRGDRHRALLGTVVVLCVFGIFGAGEFSTVIGLVVAVVALGVVSGSAKRMLAYAIPIALVAGCVMWPVIEIRLMGFQSASGMPDSWIVRLRNLNTYFWPELAAHGNWMLGVRPSARVPAAHEEFGWVWIESGYTWLLWGGGVPLLASYLYFVRASVRRAVAVVRRHDDAIAVAGMAITAAVCANVVLMLFDPHLTYRGAADAMFALLALLRPLRGSTTPGDLERLTP